MNTLWVIRPALAHDGLVTEWGKWFGCPRKRPAGVAQPQRSHQCDHADVGAGLKQVRRRLSL